MTSVAPDAAQPIPAIVSGPSGAHVLAARSLGWRWRYALKPHGWPKVLLPWWLGVGWALDGGAPPGWGIAAGAVLTVLLLVAIVLLNDWADAEVDRIKRRMFPDGCSPKTIPDGLLSGAALAAVGFTALGLFVAGGWWASSAGSAGLGWWAPIAAAVFVAYSLPPLRLNYRGGGELLEAMGVGVVLPIFSAQLVASRIPGWTTWVVAGLVGCVLLGLSSALASGLADEQSDRVGGKRTVVSIWGNPATRRGIRVALLLGLLVWVVGGGVSWAQTGWNGAGPLWAAAAVAAWPTVQALRCLPRARTNAFGEQKHFKLWLHRAIWWGTAVLGSGWAFVGLLGSGLWAGGDA